MAETSEISEILTPQEHLQLQGWGLNTPITLMAPALKPLLAAFPKLPTPYLLVDDANTHAAAGEAILRHLALVTSHLLLKDPQPSEAFVAQIEDKAAGCGAIIAVGSGTINDLCKLAAHRLGIPYVVFPTALSMNGYLSASASIIDAEDQKHSHAAAMPFAVLADLNTLINAPLRLTRAGIGDSLARGTAEADWLLSHLMHGTLYDPRPFLLLRKPEAELLPLAYELTSYDALTALLRVLMLSGLGMTLAGGSYPASQGEHMIAHAYHALHGQGDTYHGEEIGVTALYMARLQEQKLPQLPEDIQRELRSVMLPAAKIESVLKSIDAPTTTRELGWSDAAFAQAVELAPKTRDRFTFLSL